MRVVVLLIMLLGLAVQSCGSRKVEKHSKSSLKESKTSIQEQTNVTEIYFDRKKVFEIMRELNIRNGSIAFNTDGSITAKGDEIDLKNKEAGEELESVKVKEENAQIDIVQDAKKLEQEDDKKVDRKTNVFLWVVYCVLFVFILYCIRGLIKKVRLLKR